MSATGFLVHYIFKLATSVGTGLQVVTMSCHAGNAANFDDRYSCGHYLLGTGATGEFLHRYEQREMLILWQVMC